MMKRLLLLAMILALGLAPLGLAKPQPVKKIELSQSSLTLDVGISEELIVSFKPSGASSPVHWKSSNEDVATVDEGVVRALSPGQATITAKTKNGKTAKCAVTVPDKDKVVALTFDDGPVANTRKMLDVLKQHDVKATFFMLGDNVAANPAIAKEVFDAGNEIGSHSVDHKSLQKIALKDAKWQVTHSLDVIEEAIGTRPTLMRAPYGAIDKDLAKVLGELGPTFVQWSVDPRDWKDRDADTVYLRIMDKVKPGQIVLMHDLYSSTTDAVKKLIPALKKKGYTFVTVSELIEKRGLSDTAGTIIF
ncbi:polysaccharide deacetylase family protein [Bacillota bacterium Meth-B3]